MPPRHAAAPPAPPRCAAYPDDESTLLSPLDDGCYIDGYINDSEYIDDGGYIIHIINDRRRRQVPLSSPLSP